MVELLLGEKVGEDHVTTTLTHLLFFDKASGRVYRCIHVIWESAWVRRVYV